MNLILAEKPGDDWLIQAFSSSRVLDENRFS